MTEKQWLKSRDTEALLEHLQEKVSDRKLRLFAVACCQHISYLILDQSGRKAVKAAEKFAEGKCTEDDVWEEKEWADLALQDEEAKGCEDAREAASAVLEIPAFAAALEASSAAVNAVYWQLDSASDNAKTVRARKERKAQVSLLRDIFGNPFRPVAVDPLWLTSNVLALARGMYKKRDFSAMPILADALQDAGCDNDDILSHCRAEAATHVRGCWVVDLVMGLS